MINKRGHYISFQKSNILDLISIDICESLSTFWAEYQYFLKIIDNHSRRTWLSFLKNRSGAISELQKWRQKVKLETDYKLAAVRSDNALELKSILNEWCSLIGISSQYTIPYNSLQNGVAEREIWTIENSMRVMLKDADLLLKFWAEAVKTDVYLQSCINTDPWVNDESITSIQAFTGMKPSIDHLQVWGCKCYSYVDLRSVLSADKAEKLTDQKRPCIFMRYSEDTDKQYYLWASDQGAIIKSHSVMFAENVKGKTMNLKLRVQTSNTLPDRRHVSRLRKAPLEATHKPETASSKDPEADFQPDIYKSAEATCSDNHAYLTHKVNNNNQKESED